MNRISVILYSCAIVFAVGCGSSESARDREGAELSSPRVRPVIIDTDMAQDDWLAILYLLHRPDIDVRAILVASTGEATCDLGTGNMPGAEYAAGLLALTGHDDGRVVVACGRTTPLRGTHAFPRVWTENVDRLGGLSLPPAVRTEISPRLATEVLSDLLDATQEPVTILTLGPLTNIAELLEQRPDLTSKIESTWIMGGAVQVAGNLQAPGSTITDNTTAEWNIYVDPYAASVVLRHLSPYLVPLDGTNDARVSLAFRDRLRDEAMTPTAVWIHDLLSTPGNQTFIESGHFYFWDPLAAVALTDSSVCSFDVDRETGAAKTFLLEVVADESTESGRTRESPTGAPVHVCSRANGAAFEDAFLSGVNTRR